MTPRIDTGPEQRAVRRRPVRPFESALPIATGPRFPRFAAAMAAARASGAPQVSALAEPLLHDVPPTLGRDGRPPRAAQWRAPRRPGRRVGRWLGLGACVVLVGLFTATMLTQPIGAGLGQLIRPWLDWRQDRTIADARAAPPPKAAADRDTLSPAPAADRIEVLARKPLAAAAQPAAPAAAAPAPAEAEATVRVTPLPSLKPRSPR